MLRHEAQLTLTTARARRPACQAQDAAAQAPTRGFVRPRVQRRTEARPGLPPARAPPPACQGEEPAARESTRRGARPRVQPRPARPVGPQRPPVATSSLPAPEPDASASLTIASGSSRPQATAPPAKLHCGPSTRPRRRWPTGGRPPAATRPERPGCCRQQREIWRLLVSRSGAARRTGRCSAPLQASVPEPATAAAPSTRRSARRLWALGAWGLSRPSVAYPVAPRRRALP
jgi:hypothetical protein